MFQSIPGFPNYEFCVETLQVKSLGRKVKNKKGYRAVKETILKPTLTNYGYFQFGLCKDSKKHSLNRSYISWLVNTGSLPPKHLQIDHIDAVKTNDKFENLQLLTPRQNTTKGHQQNGRKLLTGVYQHKKNKNYYSRIWINSEDKYLGSFTTVEAASVAYQKALESL